MTDFVLKEIQDRCRRMETRLTKFLEQQGFDTKIKRPEWKCGTIEITNLSCALKDLLELVPHDWDRDEEVVVLYRGEEVLSFFVP